MQTDANNYYFGDDYCHCRRCPCCGKLVTAPYVTAPYTPYPWYPYPYTIIPNPISFTVPNIDWEATSTTTVAVDGEKK